MRRPQAGGVEAVADGPADWIGWGVRAADIYRRLGADGEELIALVGDLNDTPDSPPLQPLLADTDLRDSTTHPKFAGDGRPGTFGSGNARDKIDYCCCPRPCSTGLRAGVAWGPVLERVTCGALLGIW